MTTNQRQITNPWTRIWDVILYAIGQLRTVKKIYPGIMHLFIFWGVLIQVIGTAIKIMQMGLFVPFTWPLFSEMGYLWYELVMDLAGIAIILGVLMAFFRRWVIKPSFMENSWDDFYALIMLILIPLVGFFTEGLRIYTLQPAWSAWSPAGLVTAKLIESFSLNKDVADLIHPYSFVVHVGFGLFFAASIPFTKLRHMLFTPVNIFLKTDRQKGELEVIEDIMNVEVLGANAIDEFSSLDLLAFDACLQCGRCEEVCPATISGMEYSPRSLLLILREDMAGSLLIPDEKENRSLNKELLTEGFLWACTTCGHCLDVCPAFIRPPEQVINIRRAQALMTGEVPQTIGETLRNFERQGNPWGMPAQNRMGWAEGLEIKVLSPGDDVDVLFFVGCAGSFDDRNIKVSRAFAELLNKLGVDFGVLGDAEMCCGETARRLGNEYLFQVSAEENISAFSDIKFNKIVTLCPHGLNTIKNEYPRFGGEFRVMHAAEYLEELVKSGKLKLKKSHQSRNLTFHDSCYLGRYNDVYDQPRTLLSMSGIEFQEMKASQEQSFCCGGGGGAMWMETAAETRINQKRLGHALEIKADEIATACPFCLIMFDDALRSKGLTEEIQVYDLIEILNKSV